MKPGDHPEFFRFPAPAGRSRESSIRLDSEGHFWHDGARVTRQSMAQAFSRWLRQHPDDKRFILSNGYDWTYITVDDVPFFVVSACVQPEEIQLTLSDGTTEPLDLESLSIGRHDALYCRVKGGEFEARFQPQAQTELASALFEAEDGSIGVRAGDKEVVVQHFRSEARGHVPSSPPR